MAAHALNAVVQRTRAAVFVTGMLLGGCQAAPESGSLPVAATSEPSAAAAEPSENCDKRIPVYEGGRSTRSLCPGEILRDGLTVIDLSDDWVQYVFSEDPSLGEAGKQLYRDKMIALANERYGEEPEWDRPKDDRHLEFYGVFPSLGVIKKRLLNEKAHRCHDAVDDSALEAFQKPLGPWREGGQRTEKYDLEHLTEELDRARLKLGLDSIAALDSDPRFKSYMKRLRDLETPVQALTAVQAHLACDGLLDRYAEKLVYDWPTTISMKKYQRKHMVVSWGVVDDATKKLLLTDSRELDFRALLRALRERVMDASGIIEDGSARNDRGKVLGRNLDPEEFHTVLGHEPLKNGAPDRLAAATQTAAEALGWTSPKSARRFFEQLPADATATLRVAIKLPPLPDYHASHMDLRVTIDRGDVYYDFPYKRNGKQRVQKVERRPALTLYAKTKKGEVALLRWPTTIGGWKPENIDGNVVMKYKGSVEGERIWRDLIVSPAWVPAESVPEREIVRKRPSGKGWTANTDIFGPGYGSAYGLLMLIHHRVAKLRNVPEQLHDEGIRSHGSVSYESIQRGYSHGCHRLYNHMALRMGTFLLRHRKHVRHGSLRIDYTRKFSWKGTRIKLDFPSRGYRYELDPAVPVTVLPGRIQGQEQRMPTHTRALPGNLVAHFSEGFDPSD